MHKLLEELLNVSYMAGHLAGSGFLGSPLHAQYSERAEELCVQISRLLTQRSPDALCSCYMPNLYQQHNPPVLKCAKCGKPARR